MKMSCVTLAGVEAARSRIKGIIHETPIISSEKIDEIAGCRVLFKCEHLQKTGSFKARGASNSVLLLKEQGTVKGVITHSSGNHGQALAWAARKASLPACVVVPRNAPKSKLEAMKDYEAQVELCENTIHARESGCAKLAEELNYGIVEPFNYQHVIEGQGTIGLEIVEQVPDLDAVFVAVGGGGMASGVVLAIKQKLPHVKVVGGKHKTTKTQLSERVNLVEPEGKDLGNYLNSGEFALNSDTLDTVADGIRVLRIGDLCFPILKQYTTQVITVCDEEIREALKLLWTRTKQRVEPAAGVPLAGLLKQGRQLGVKKAVVVLCGGNVDMDFIP